MLIQVLPEFWQWIFKNVPDNTVIMFDSQAAHMLINSILNLFWVDWDKSVCQMHTNANMSMFARCLCITYNKTPYRMKWSIKGLTCQTDGSYLVYNSDSGGCQISSDLPTQSNLFVIWQPKAGADEWKKFKILFYQWGTTIWFNALCQ